jgi:5-methylcytosine-specific restriction enzyme subunit McrC
VALAVHLREWARLAPGEGDGAALAGVGLASVEERALARRLSERGMLHVRELRRGLEIESTSFVGRIRVGDLTVTVSPKLRTDALLRLFCYGHDLRDLLDPTSFAEGGSLFQDLLLAQLHAEASDILSRGLRRAYLAVAEELGSPRGRIDVHRLALRLPAGQATLPCRHHLRLEDCALNQVLLAGLELGATVATDRSLAASLHRLAATLATRVRRVPLTGPLLTRARHSIDRLTEAYVPAFRLVELILDAVSPSLDDDDGESLSLHGFLFDMNRFFQRLVSRFLRENLDGCKVAEERSLAHLMRYAPGENPSRRRSPRPRPDFEVTTQGGARTLLDAKYRDLWEHALPRDILYQLAIYALSQPPGGRATILYPTSTKGALPSRIELGDDAHGWSRASVVLRPIDLDELDRAIAAGDGRAATKDRAALARRLVFGTPAGGLAIAAG